MVSMMPPSVYVICMHVTCHPAGFVDGGIWIGSLWEESPHLYINVEVEELAVEGMIACEQDGTLVSEEFRLYVNKFRVTSD